MKDTQLYEQLLGLSKPWSVRRVDLELEHNRITVHVECDKGTVWGDPETGQDRAHIHGWVERTWRHLDTCQFETRIAAKVPRLRFKSGRVEDAVVPWAERYSRITVMMEAFVVRLLQAAAKRQSCHDAGQAGLAHRQRRHAPSRGAWAAAAHRRGRALCGSG